MTDMGRIPAESLVQELVAGLAEMAGVPVALVNTPRERRRPVVWVRAMAIKWLRAHESNYSTTGIGIRLGGLDHSTVLYHLGREWSGTSGTLRSRPIPMAKYLALKREAANTVPRKKRAMCRLRELLSAYETSGSKIFTADIARVLSISSGAAAALLSKLHDEGKIRRTSHGVFQVVQPAKPVPIAPIAILPIAFIRPISKERMMAGR